LERLWADGNITKVQDKKWKMFSLAPSREL
jgi:hypothetical protein